MNRADFGEWGADLDNAGFWRAVVLLGLGDAGGWVPARGHDAAAWVAAVIETLPDAAEPLDERAGPWWRIPGSLLQAAQRGALIDAGALAAEWPALAASGRMPPRLRADLPLADEAELSAALRSHAGLRVVHPLTGTAVGTDWQWPMRFAIPDTPGDAPSRAAFERLRAHSSTAQRLTRLTTPDADPVVEWLVLRSSLADAPEAVDALAQPVRAHVVLLFAPNNVHPALFATLSRLQRLTLCKAVVVVDEPIDSVEYWLYRLVHELAHDLPLDVVLDTISQRPALKFFDPAVHAMTRIGRFAEHVVGALRATNLAPIELTDEEAATFGLPAGRHDGGDVAARLEEALRSPDAFGEERRAATWTVRVLDAARRAGLATPATWVQVASPGSSTSRLRVLRSVPGALGDHRRVRADVRAGGELVRHFRKARVHSITVSIAARGGQHAAPLFPVDLLPVLPGDEAGHLLTVTLYAPGFLEQPQLQTIFLPRGGDSTACEFEFDTGAERPWFEARLSFAFRNRTLQTMLLRGSVLGLSADSGRPIELVSEMATQSGWGGLAEQAAYGATIVLNKLGDDKGITVQSGYKVLGFSIPQLDSAIDEIESRIDSSDWAAADMQGMAGSGSRKLLLCLAQHGAVLYNVVRLHAQALAGDGRALLRNLEQAAIVQVMAANLGARLPVEFFYGNDFPDDDATICPQHAQSLGSADCGTCAHRSPRHFCPAGLWSLSKAIEWHHFDQVQARLEQFAPRDFALQTADAASRRDRLRPIDDVVVGISEQVGQVDAQGAPAMLARIRALGVRVHAAADWADVDRLLDEHRPGLLLLLPHMTKTKVGLEALEIGGSTRNIGVIQRMVLHGDGQAPGPVVMLLGCNTDNAGLQFRSFPVAMSGQATVVIATISYLLGRHAAPLAARLVEAIVAAQRGSAAGSTPPFGEVMLAARRAGMCEALPPLSLVLKSYGDARWRC